MLTDLSLMSFLNMIFRLELHHSTLKKLEKARKSLKIILKVIKLLPPHLLPLMLSGGIFGMLVMSWRTLPKIKYLKIFLSLRVLSKDGENI